MMNYASDFSQSETEKYFEWIININVVFGSIFSSTWKIPGQATLLEAWLDSILLILTKLF